MNLKTDWENKIIRTEFRHGFGDCSQYAKLLQLWKRRGYDIHVLGDENKAWLWKGAGFTYHREPGEHEFVRNVWGYPWSFGHLSEPDWSGNKTAHNLATEFLPIIGNREGLWRELIDVTVDVRVGVEQLQEQADQRVMDWWKRTLNPAGPVIAFHWRGNAWRERKSIPREVMIETMRLLVDAGCIVLALDWEERGGWLDHPAVVNPNYAMGGQLDTITLASLLTKCDALIGIDSGPFHFAGLLPGVKALGVFYPTLHANHCCLPNPSAVYLVPERCRPKDESIWTCVGYQGNGPSPEKIAGEALTLVGRPDLKPVPPGPDSLMYESGWWIRKRPDLAQQDRNVIGEVIPDGYRCNRLSLDQAGLFVVDVGAHIGSFTKYWRDRDARAQLVAVEACPENLAALRANVARYADVIHAACTYEAGEIMLLNSVKEDGTATGGSIVVAKDAEHQPFQANPNLYWRDDRSLPTITLEQIMERAGRSRIDVLKLDCEGSEFSILAGCDIDRIGFICGEYHGEQRWEAFVKDRFAGWRYEVFHRAGNLGVFHLRNPVWCRV
jgi:FkbM family methyltransferase